MKTVIICIIALAMQGCGLMFHDREQTIQVDLIDKVAHTNCSGKNERGTYYLRGDRMKVERSDTDLIITCNNSQQVGELAVEPHTVWKYYVWDVIIAFPCLFTCMAEDYWDGADRYPDRVKLMLDYKYPQEN